MEITKYKSKLDISYALGTTVCFELLTNKPKQVVKLFIHPKLNRDETYTKILNLAIKNNIEVIESIKPFNILADKDNCFVIAEFKKYDMKINNNNNHVLLVNPSNTGNLGTIIRTMLGFNITDLAIIVPTVDIFDPKTIRSSMGAIFSLNIQLFNSYDEYIKNNSDKHIFPFMLKAKKAIKNISVPNKWTLIFGNESSGLDDSYLNVGVPIIIKHSNKIDSLNLAMSVGIGLFYFNS